MESVIKTPLSLPVSESAIAYSRGTEVSFFKRNRSFFSRTKSRASTFLKCGSTKESTRAFGVHTGGTDHDTEPGLLFFTPRAKSSTISRSTGPNRYLHMKFLLIRSFVLLLLVSWPEHYDDQTCVFSYTLLLVRTRFV